MRSFCVIAAAAVGVSLAAVVLQESKAVTTVSNKYCTLTIDNVKGALKTLTFGDRKYAIYGSQEFRANGEQKVFTGQYSAIAPLINANNTKQEITVVDRSEDQVTIRCELKKPFMTSVIFYIPRLFYDDVTDSIIVDGPFDPATAKRLESNSARNYFRLK